MTTIETTYSTFKVTLEEIENKVYSVRIDILGSTLNLGNIFEDGVRDDEYLDQFIKEKLADFSKILISLMVNKIKS